MPNSIVDGYQYFRGSKFLLNNGNYLQSYMATEPRRLQLIDISAVHFISCSVQHNYGHHVLNTTFVTYFIKDHIIRVAITK